MNKIFVLSFGAKGKTGQERGLLIDDRFAITADGDAVYLTEVVSTEWPDVFRAKEPFNFIQVGKGGKSSSYLNHVVARLNSLSAYQLLTEHYVNIGDGQFDVMRQMAKQQKGANHDT
jgi:N-dimethylarginine dimethylaminohydrolase